MTSDSTCDTYTLRDTQGTEASTTPFIEQLGALQNGRQNDIPLTGVPDLIVHGVTTPARGWIC